MELQVKEISFPQIIEFNYSELKQEITNRTSQYMSLVYTENQIQEAKKDVATLRKFTKALSDERIKVKKKCLEPYEDFEAKIKELDAIVDAAIQNIDSQVKNYEEQKKTEKQVAIVAYFESANSFDWLKLEQIFNHKWLNATVKLANATAEIDCAIEQIAKDLETLSNLPEFAFEATEEYKRSLDLNKAITEGKRLAEIQKKKAEAEENEKALLKQAPTEQPQKQWVGFKALLSNEDALALRSLFESRNIQFEPIESEEK